MKEAINAIKNNEKFICTTCEYDEKTKKIISRKREEKRWREIDKDEQC